MKQYPSVYIPVDVKEKLPEHTGWYDLLTGDPDPRCTWQKAWFELGSWWEETGLYNMILDPIFWLEKQDSAIVCTKEELEELIQVARDDAYAFNDGYSPETNKYLESKGIKL